MVFGQVAAYLGGGEYRVTIGGASCRVQAAQGVQAAEGQTVAVAMEGGRPVAMLGAVNPPE